MSGTSKQVSSGVSPDATMAGDPGESCIGSHAGHYSPDHRVLEGFEGGNNTCRIGENDGCVEATKTAAASAENTLHRLVKLSEFVGSDPETPEPTPRLETEPSVYRISWLRNRVAVSSRTDLLSSSVLYPLLKRWWSRYWREASVSFALRLHQDHERLFGWVWDHC